MKVYTLKVRGGVEVDSYGKKAGKGALVQEELSGTLGVSQDQYLFQPIGIGCDMYNQVLTGSVSKTMTNKATDSDHVPCVIIMNPHDSQGNQIAASNGIYPALRGCGGAGYQQGYVMARLNDGSV